jgi:hypothetical protein
VAAGAGGGAVKVRRKPVELRLAKDLAEIDSGAVAQLTAVDASGRNVQALLLKVSPEQGLWKGASFDFTVDVPDDYPHNPPKVKCVTKIYHPNIDREGNVCLNILRAEWKPIFTISEPPRGAAGGDVSAWARVARVRARARAPPCECAAWTRRSGGACAARGLRICSCARAYVRFAPARRVFGLLRPLPPRRVRRRRSRARVFHTFAAPAPFCRQCHPRHHLPLHRPEPNGPAQQGGGGDHARKPRGL